MAGRALTRRLERRRFPPMNRGASTAEARFGKRALQNTMKQIPHAARKRRERVRSRNGIRDAKSADDRGVGRVPRIEFGKRRRTILG